MAADLVSELRDFLDRSPTPYHAVHQAQTLLEAAGFRRLLEEEAWQLSPGDRVYVTRADASIAALIVGQQPAAESGFRLIGAHTDSPNLRVKPHADLTRAGYQQLGVEVYGGVLLSTWLDRDLSLAGRLMVERDGQLKPVLIDLQRPIARIPNLAIHLNRTVNSEGLKLNAQAHLPPVIALSDTQTPVNLESLIAEALRAKGPEYAQATVYGFDLCFYDVQKATIAGTHGEFIHSARLDNLMGCFAALKPILDARTATPFTRGIVLYDHEEVGSRSAQGADSTFLEQLLLRLSTAQGAAGPEALPRALARSFFISCDTAHAIHPNYQEMHDGNHSPRLGRGPVVKRHSSQSYATDGESSARFALWCRQAEVTPQQFVTRSDLGCGSTIGPISAARLGFRTIDVGHPLLSMHSIREMGAVADVGLMNRVLTAYFSS